MPSLRSALAHPWVYRALQLILGADRGRKKLLRDHIRPRPNDSILDIGCGPADIVGYLPNVRYVGFDASEEYIANARERWGARGEFICGNVSETSVAPASFDIVLAIGVLHHLTDEEVRSLFHTAALAVRGDGRIITVDGAYVRGQSPVAKYLLSKDRGEYVRAPEAYKALAEETFGNVETFVFHNLMFPIPYTHLIMECASPKVTSK